MAAAGANPSSAKSSPSRCNRLPLSDSRLHNHSGALGYDREIQGLSDEVFLAFVDSGLDDSFHISISLLLEEKKTLLVSSQRPSGALRRSALASPSITAMPAFARNPVDPRSPGSISLTVAR